jgi:hypothetical protein
MLDLQRGAENERSVLRILFGNQRVSGVPRCSDIIDD